MRAYDLAFVSLRIFAVISVVTGLTALLSVSKIFMSLEDVDPEAEPYIFASVCLAVIFGCLIFAFAGRLAWKMVPGKVDDCEPETERGAGVTVAGLLEIGLAMIGVYLVATGLPELVQNVVVVQSVLDTPSMREMGGMHVFYWIDPACRALRVALGAALFYSSGALAQRLRDRK